MKRAVRISARASLGAFALGAILLASGCGTTSNTPQGAPVGGAAAATSIQKVEYFPFQVKGYQGSYPHRTMIVLAPVEQRDFKNVGNVDTAPMGANPAVGDVFNNGGFVIEKVYSDPLVPIVQQALIRAASEAGFTASASTDTEFKPALKHAGDYFLASKITRCWVRRLHPNGQHGQVWRSSAEFALEIRIFKSPFSVPFWQGTSSDSYFDPPIGSFGLGSEDDAGIYDNPGEVLSVALTRAVAGVFEKEDLHNLVLDDDIHPR